MSFIFSRRAQLSAVSGASKVCSIGSVSERFIWR